MLMRTGVLAVALVVFALLRTHGLAVQLRVLLREAMLLLARCLRLLFLLLQLRDACLFLRVHANRFFRGSSAVLWKWCMYMRGGLHQMRRLVLLRLLPVHGGMWRGGSGACTCVGDCTKCGAWCCCACCLSTAGCGVDAAGAL
ncbi:hypothetical protein [Xanthomonas sp. MUS 060]|uniref:hypothetical protein n=1 Tax=Xanthomonas sp. MUS 060 TaxID=1588031 RepID=UPI001269AE2A|nr:hypothetical protein [Xanthomonas sp. MUS 060]